MAGPSPKLTAAEDVRREPPIGELHIYVYGWERGQSEVQIRYPQEALYGAPEASTLGPRFNQMLVEELKGSFAAFERFNP